MGLVVHDAEVAGYRGRVDIGIEQGTITSIGEGTPPGADVVDAGGGAVIPGLVDHHVHLLSWAAALTSTPCGPPLVTDRDALSRNLRQPAEPDSWLRGVGYHESVAGPLDRDAL